MLVFRDRYMRQEVILSSLSKRVVDRTNLVLVLLVGGIFCIFRLLPDLPPPRFLDLVLPFALLYIHLALAPIPWQWTGDDAPRAGLGRGILQSLAFHGAWIGGLLVAFHLLIGSSREALLPPRPPPLLEGDVRPVLPPREGLRGFGPGLGLASINLAFAIVFGWVFAEKESTELRERQMADRLRESRVRALQNQLDPHVLYNALSSLSELVYEDPLAAEDVITRLADLYRMLTVHGQAERVPLGQERRLVEAYLAMEQMRLGDRLDVQWDWPSALDAVEAPPLFLQPLVENAIKHGISPSETGGRLCIACAQEGNRLELVVRNNGAPLQPGAPRGVGLGNLEERLNLWREAEGRFSLDREGPWTVARVRWMKGTGA